MIGIKEFSGFKDFGSGLTFCHTIFRFFFCLATIYGLKSGRLGLVFDKGSAVTFALTGLTFFLPGSLF